MNIRRLHHSQRPNIYPGYFIDTFLSLTSFDEWDFTQVESWDGGRYANSPTDLIQILNPDLIVKMEARVKIAKTKLSSGIVDSRLWTKC